MLVTPVHLYCFNGHGVGHASFFFFFRYAFCVVAYVPPPFPVINCKRLGIFRLGVSTHNHDDDQDDDDDNNNNNNDDNDDDDDGNNKD